MELSLVDKADRWKDSSKKKRKVSEESSDFGHKKREGAEMDIPEQSDKNNLAVGTALENFLILKEIFSNLGPADLKSCCEVNETWRSIADPMIVCHDVVWSRDDLMVDEITRGHVNPQIEMKIWRVGMTGELARLLEGNRDPGSCIRLAVKHVYLLRKPTAFEFFRTFGQRVFALTYRHGYWSNIVTDREYGPRPNHKDFLNFLVEFFPNLEELSLPELLLEKKRLERIPYNFPPLVHLRKVDFGFRAEISKNAMVEILEVMPNVEEIDNFPITMLKILQDAGKFHTLRSVQFCSTYDTKLDDKALQSLVDMGLRLRSLIVGKKLPHWSNLMYIKRNKARFRSLLELGKDSLEHLVLPPLQNIGFLQFPPKMTALKHISFRGKFSKVELCEERRYFPLDFDLLGTFPNLNKFSIQDEESAVLSHLSFPRETFGVEKLGDAIKILRVPSELSERVVSKLTKLFPCVESVERVEFDLEYVSGHSYGRVGW